MSNHRNSTALPAISIAGVEITRDEEGRYNLNALHRASGAEKKDGPSYWLALESTQDLIAELDAKTTGMSVVSKEGRSGGTFAHELLVVSYAGWIRPSFQLDVNQVFLDVRSGKLPLHTMPLPAKLKAVGDIMHGFSRIAGLLGLKGNQRALSAAIATRRETGVDVLQLTGATHLQADVQDQFLTPTQIALRTDPTSSNQKVNVALEEMRFQMEHRKKVKGKDRHDYWELTDAGKAAGGDYLDTAKKHRDGTPVKQIKWPASVIALVQQHMNGDVR